MLRFTKLVKASPFNILFCNNARSINWWIILFPLAYSPKTACFLVVSSDIFFSISVLFVHVVGIQVNQISIFICLVIFD